MSAKRPDSALLAVRVQPGTKNDALVGWREGTLWLKVAAPAKENKANEAVIAFLARLLGVPKSNISIKNGLASRNKVLAIAGLTADEVRDRLKTTLF